MNHRICAHSPIQNDKIKRHIHWLNVTCFRNNICWSYRLKNIIGYNFLITLYKFATLIHNEVLSMSIWIIKVSIYDRLSGLYLNTYAYFYCKMPSRNEFYNSEMGDLICWWWIGHGSKFLWLPSLMFWIFIIGATKNLLFVVNQ